MPAMGAVHRINSGRCASEVRRQSCGRLLRHIRQHLEPLWSTTICYCSSLGLLVMAKGLHKGRWTLTSRSRRPWWSTAKAVLCKRGE